MSSQPSETLSNEPDLTVDPPQTVWGILSNLGPGLIIAGAIVGSGELIATTKTGAEAGFTLLWLIVIGCLIKVFVQVEMGRYCIVTGNTSMTGMNEVPGPRFHVNWLMWYWLAMFVMGLAQLGGIVGGVGQALAISYPVTQQGEDYNLLADAEVHIRETKAKLQGENLPPLLGLEEELQQHQAEFQQQLVHYIDHYEPTLTLETFQNDLLTLNDLTSPYDSFIWATIVAVCTSLLLLRGRYNLVQDFSTALVAAFTGMTIINLIAIQSHHRWAISSTEFWSGFLFQLPNNSSGMSGWEPVVTALATFGIIGVGSTELISYPYWCLEKGYARFIGPRDDSKEWGERAKGWLRVLRWDAFCSMVIYTLATIAFFLLGAAVLSREGLNPEGNQMIRMLGEMYVPGFGAMARTLFLFGAFAVLYSTFFVASAGHARVGADALIIFKIIEKDEEKRWRWIWIFSALFPFVCLGIYCFVQAPAYLVLASGVMQAIMLPMLGLATLYFRYYRCDPRIAPGKSWDFFLWLSVVGLLFAGLSLVGIKLMDLFA
ncbi:Manganese transporter NRAMP [Planctomycetales bacterium 10988]|nr:Manganese transporter NRAMP [Planctomycetales bacterium 10988]